MRVGTGGFPNVQPCTRFLCAARQTCDRTLGNTIASYQVGLDVLGGNEILKNLSLLCEKIPLRYRVEKRVLVPELATRLYMIFNLDHQLPFHTIQQIHTYAYCPCRISPAIHDR